MANGLSRGKWVVGKSNYLLIAHHVRARYIDFSFSTLALVYLFNYNIKNIYNYILDNNNSNDPFGHMQ